MPGTDAEMTELRLRSEFRDKEVARLNAVIERLQEKTHAHVSAMNAELRAEVAAHAEAKAQVAVLGERVRAAAQQQVGGWVREKR